MKRIHFFFYYIILAFVSVICNLTIALAQKLPTTQRRNLCAPDNINIDGKFLEWGDTFQAHNKATDIFYSISNDVNNLYLVVQATDPVVISNKILTGGITLVIQKSHKKSDKNAISISYPAFDKGSLHRFNLVNNKKDIPASPDLLKKFNDSTMISNNNILMTAAKNIKVKGLPNVDTLISIYNEERIKVAALFDDKKNYTYELSVPLSLLGINAINATKFSYHILLNGGSSKYTPGQFVVMTGMNRDHSPLSQVQMDRANSAVSNLNLTFETTDFWGEYTLAKKP